MEDRGRPQHQSRRTGHLVSNGQSDVRSGIDRLRAREYTGPTMEGVSLRPRCCQHQRRWSVALIASIALVSCGTSTFTVVGTNTSGMKTYLVVSGNVDDVAQIKDSYAGGGGGGQILDGDHHSGELICEHDSAKNGHHLHFALYGTTISTEQCQRIFAEFP